MNDVVLPSKIRKRLEQLDERALPSTSNWFPLNSNTGVTLRDVAGNFDHTNAAPVGSIELAVGDGGTILYPTDASRASWSVHPSGTSKDLFGIGGSKHDYIVGASGTILHSTDQGATWVPQLSGTTATLRSITEATLGSLIDAMHGPYTWLIAVGDGGTILRSLDGVTWLPASSGTPQSLTSVFTEHIGGLNGDVLFAVGAAGTILRSQDGVNWTSEYSGTIETLHDGISGGPAFGSFVVGDHGVILASFDHGVNWVAEGSGTRENLNSVSGNFSIYGENRGAVWAVGDHGTISLAPKGTLNSVAFFRLQDSGTQANLYAAAAAHGYMDVLTVGRSGTMLEFHGIKVIASGADFGSPPEVRVYDAQTGELLRMFMAYDEKFSGGVRVAVGDVNGDGQEDIITAPGPGGAPHIKVFDGATGNLLREFFAYDPGFTGGVNIAFANNSFSFSGYPGGPLPAVWTSVYLVTGADAGGGPHVRVFDLYGEPREVSSFFAFNSDFRGGVRVALLGTGPAPEIIVGAGPGGGPHVKAFDFSGQELQSFFAYDASFHGGVYVGSQERNIVTGAGPGGGPHVRVFDENSKLLREFYAYDPKFSGGVRVSGIADIDGDFVNDIATSFGPSGPSQLAFFGGMSGQSINRYDVLDPTMTYGAFVAGSKRVDAVWAVQIWPTR